MSNTNQERPPASGPAFNDANHDPGADRTHTASLPGLACYNAAFPQCLEKYNNYTNYCRNEHHVENNEA